MLSPAERAVCDSLGPLRAGNKVSIAMFEYIHTSLEQALSDTGNSIAEQIVVFNGKTDEQDPDDRSARDIALRFDAWMRAVDSLHDRDETDFSAELARIHEVSNVREDAIVIQRDVCLVAVYHLAKWSGAK